MLNESKFIPDHSELISICISTYKRVNLLKNLLESLANQVLPTSIKIEIIITDNDPSASAYDLIIEFKKKYNIEIKYYIQPHKNISITRNLSVSNATGNYIAFIDDDETADKFWIDNLLNALKKHDADGVFGFVIPLFEESIPEKFKKREYYFSFLEKTGSIAKHYYTTNCLLKSHLIKSEKIPFDPNYGLTGGEDVHLFERLSKKGARFITCKEAITYEFIPRGRATLKYLYIRALRGGQSFLRRKLEFGNYNFFMRFSELLKLLIILPASVILFTISFIFPGKEIKYVIFIGDSIGKLRAIFKIYKNIY
jgi:succinoglycan biosynthesis protein ExoM